MIEFREYQMVAVEEILNYSVDHPSGSLLVVVPARGGKTAIAAEVTRWLAHQNGMRALWFARGRELVLHAHRHLVEVGVPEDAIGMILSGDDRYDPARPIQLASFDTINRRNKPPTDLVLSDEAHHDAADGRRLLRALYPEAFKVGFTGSPVRSDNRGLGDDYDDMIEVVKPSELIAQGYVAAPRIFTLAPEHLPDLRGVKRRAGDFDLGELERVTNLPQLNENVVVEWKRLAEGRRTIVYPTTVRHSQNLVADFQRAGIAAEHLDGTTKTEVRRGIIAKLRSGQISVVSSCGVLNEGVDLPEVKCAAIVCATQSLAKHIQQNFRPLTPWGDVKPLILDFAGNVLRPGLGLPHADRPWTLHGIERPAPRGKRQGGADAADRTRAKRCPCGAVSLLDAPACEVCQRSFRGIDNDPGELVEMKSKYTVEEQDAEWARIRAFAKKIGAKPAWAAKVFHLRMGPTARRLS